MAQVYPFRAFRYNPARAPFERVLTQPYDKISPAMQEKYYAADPHNLIAVEKGRTYPSDTPQNNVYTRAAAGTEERRTRRGFIGAGKLEEYSAGVVFRHEHTLSGPKADRLELLRHTKTHTGQLFMLYSDAQRRIDGILAPAEAEGKPATEMRDEYGVVHRLWVIAEPQRVAAIQKAMEDQKLVIADGHHRYETALNYRNERRTRAGKIDPEAPYERVMMTFINARSEGLTILPTHRVAANVHDFSWSGVRRHLEPWFAAEEFPFSGSGERSEVKKKFLARLTGAQEKRAIGVYPAAGAQKRAFYVLTLREGANLGQLLPSVSPLQRELDVVLLHEGILEPALGITPQAVTAEANLTYEREAIAALDAVDSGRGDAPEIDGLLSQAAERDHHVQSGKLEEEERNNEVRR